MRWEAHGHLTRRQKFGRFATMKAPDTAAPSWPMGASSSSIWSRSIVTDPWPALKLLRSASAAPHLSVPSP